MKMIVRIAFAAAIAVAFAGSAQAQRQRPGQAQPGQAQPGQAQPGQGGFGQGGGSLRSMLHTSKPLQEELKLTDDQITKFKEYAEKNAPQRGQGGAGGGFGGGAGGFGGGGSTSDLDSIESLKAQIKTLEERLEFMNKTFTKEQAERFAQLETQRMGLRAFSSARIAKELKITDDQKKRITEISTDLQSETRKLFTGGMGRPDAAAFAEMAKKTAQLTEYAMEAIEKELTGDQKSNWTKMVGTKFDMSKLRTAAPTNN